MTVEYELIVDAVPGPAGPVGPQGDVGPVGPQGDVGPVGPQGDVGPSADQADLTAGTEFLVEKGGVDALDPAGSSGSEVIRHNWILDVSPTCMFAVHLRMKINGAAAAESTWLDCLFSGYRTPTSLNRIDNVFTGTGPDAPGGVPTAGMHLNSAGDVVLYVEGRNRHMFYNLLGLRGQIGPQLFLPGATYVPSTAGTNIA